MNLEKRQRREDAGRADETTQAELSELFAAITRGGADAENAVAKLYDAYARPLLRFQRSRGFTLEEAEDIVQDGFLKLFLAGEKLLNVEAPRAYLYQTMLHAGHDLLRRKQRSAKEQTVEPDVLIETAEATSMPDNDGFDGFEDCLEAAFARFEADSPDRATAVLLGIEGFSGQEIADVLERTYKAAREFLSQSRKRFRLLVDEMCGEYRPAEGS